MTTPKPKNLSVYPSDALRIELDAHAPNRTRRINQIWERYDSIIGSCSLELEPDERQVLQNALKDKVIDLTAIRFIAKIILESDDYAAGAGAAKSLHQKLKGADYPALLATVERAGF